MRKMKSFALQNLRQITEKANYTSNRFAVLVAEKAFDFGNEVFEDTPERLLVVKSLANILGCYNNIEVFHAFKKNVLNDPEFIALIGEDILTFVDKASFHLAEKKKHLIKSLGTSEKDFLKNFTLFDALFYIDITSKYKDIDKFIKDVFAIIESDYHTAKIIFDENVDEKDAIYNGLLFYCSTYPFSVTNVGDDFSPKNFMRTINKIFGENSLLYFFDKFSKMRKESQKEKFSENN